MAALRLRDQTEWSFPSPAGTTVLLSVGVLLLVETKLREERERGIAADPETGRKLEGYAILTFDDAD